MVAANLTGGEAEELRKAMGGKRSDAVLASLKTRLIDGMTANGFDAAQQAEVMRVLSTMREFMFPESHAQGTCNGRMNEVESSDAKVRFLLPDTPMVVTGLLKVDGPPA